MGKKDILFLGNGINYLCDGTDKYSWESLLRDMLRLISSEAEIKEYKKVPFTLLYDNIELSLNELEHFEKRSSYINDKITEWIRRIQPNEYHKKIMNLNFSNIITTNCDYNLELSVDNNFESKSHEIKNVKELKFNIHRFFQINSTKIWHIHGEIDKSNTLTFGFEHYSDHLRKVVDFIKSRLDPEKENFKLLEEFKNLNDLNYDLSWIHVFLHFDVHILGLGLDYSEMVLWYLIAKKEKLRRQYDKSNFGKTYFYYFPKEDEDESQLPKITLLMSLGVNVKRIENKNYQEAYDAFISTWQENNN